MKATTTKNTSKYLAAREKLLAYSSIKKEKRRPLRRKKKPRAVIYATFSYTLGTRGLEGQCDFNNVFRVRQQAAHALYTCPRTLCRRAPQPHCRMRDDRPVPFLFAPARPRKNKWKIILRPLARRRDESGAMGWARPFRYRPNYNVSPRCVTASSDRCARPLVNKPLTF